MYVLKKFGLGNILFVSIFIECTDKSEPCVWKAPISLLFSSGNITSDFFFVSLSVTVFTGILIDKFNCILYFLVYNVIGQVLHICFNWFYVMFISKMDLENGKKNLKNG